MKRLSYSALLILALIGLFLISAAPGPIGGGGVGSQISPDLIWDSTGASLSKMRSRSITSGVTLTSLDNGRLIYVTNAAGTTVIVKMLSGTTTNFNTVTRVMKLGAGAVVVDTWDSIGKMQSSVSSYIKCTDSGVGYIELVLGPTGITRYILTGVNTWETE